MTRVLIPVLFAVEVLPGEELSPATYERFTEYVEPFEKLTGATIPYMGSPVVTDEANIDDPDFDIAVGYGGEALPYYQEAFVCDQGCGREAPEGCLQPDCPHLTRDWHAEGVFWSGVPGDEIQRLDDMQDYGRTESRFGGDMEAALFVARNGFPWLLYEQNPEVEDGHWFVTAHRTREEAEKDRARSARSDTLLFIFDGRTERPIPKPNGNGFLPPKPTERTS